MRADARLSGVTVHFVAIAQFHASASRAVVHDLGAGAHCLGIVVRFAHIFPNDEQILVTFRPDEGGIMTKIYRIVGRPAQSIGSNARKRDVSPIWKCPAAVRSR